MKRIYKYKLNTREGRLTPLPTGAAILTIAMQHNMLCLWAIVDMSVTTETRRDIRVIGTGWDIDDPVGTYLATVQDGGYVWHIFEVPADAT